MSNVYDVNDLDPDDLVNRELRRTRASAVLDLEADPEQAARSMQIAKTTGIPAPVVDGDYEHYDGQLRATLTGQLVQQSPELQEYIRRNQMASRVSNDDYQNLDNTSQAVKAIPKKGYLENMGEMYQALWKTVVDGPQEAGRLAESAKDFMIKQGVPPDKAAANAQMFESRAKRNEAIMNALFFIPTALAMPVFAGFRTYAAQPIEEKTEFPAEATEGLAIGALGLIGLPFMRAGKAVPKGVSEATDKVHVEQAKMDKDALGEALKQATSTATRERAPELFENFIKQHTDESIGVNADAVRALYGDKAPTPDDGLLGWVPRLQEQLQAAEATGGDVQIPLASYLTKVDPEVHKALADWVRMRPEGLSVEEAKVGIEAWHGSPHEFEAFDIGKAGTGEGAQSYGFGHYFAEQVDVAKEYQKMLSLEDNPQHAAWQTMQLFKENREEGKAALRRAIEELELGEKDSFGHSKETLEKAIKILESDKPVGKAEAGGSLYKARILRRQEEFLDLDAPLDRNDPRLQAAYQKANMDLTGATDARDMYDQLASRLGSPEKASEALAAEGIAGIKYLDQFSREAALKKNAHDIAQIENALKEIDAELAKGPNPELQAIRDATAKNLERYEPTRNFVVFRDADIEVLERNGQIVKALRQANRLEPIGVPLEGEILPTDAQRKQQLYEQAAARSRTGQTAGQIQERMQAGAAAAERYKQGITIEGEAKPTTAAKQLELPVAGTTRMEDRAPFDRGAAIGMTQDQYKRYQALIAKRLAEDTKAAENRITAEERKKQTAEWKANRAEMRTQVLADLKSQPEYEMLQMLDDGNLKFAADSLTETQRAILPKSWVTKEGIHPDDLAMLFGEGNSSALVDRVTGLFSSRAAANMKPMEFTRRMTDIVTDQRMEEKYGNFNENVINEARDQILSETQESMLHEETLAVATQAGQQYPIAKVALVSQLRKNFREMTMREVDADRFLSDAGRAGRVAEIALLKGDPLEAFRQKQRQFNAMVFAKEAARVEKLNDQFDKMAKRASARELSGTDQEYLNWVHDVLMRTGNPVKRSVQDLGESLARGAQGDTLAKFVDSVQSFYLREMPVADFIQDPAFNKPVKDLTVTEFQQLHDAVKSMLKNGRDEFKINKAGEEADLKAVKAEMIEQVQQLPQLEYDAKGERIHPGYIPVKGAKEIRKFGVSHIQTESMLNRIDKGNAWGVFNQYVMRPLVESSHRESQLERAYAKEVRALKSEKFDHKRALPNDILMDPYSVRRGDPQPMRMTEENLMAVIMNMGNESNFDKFARGYLAATDTMPAGDNYLAVFKDQLRQWVHANSTKEHWDWAQKFGDIYDKFKREEVDPMYRRVAGIEPASLDIEGVSTPHGDYKGWYYPIIYHPLHEGKSRALMGGDALEGPHYTRATVPHGYIEKRTGYAGPIDLSLDRGITRLKEMIHDVAFREAVINASKVFYDDDVRAAIAHHMNKEYRDMLVPYLRDVANASAVRNELRVLDGSLGETIRQNLISTLVGMNPGTVAKHGFTALMQSIHEVGGKEFLNAVASMTVKDLDVAESNWKFAMKHSGELQRRIRNYQEVLRGGSENLFREATWRDVMIQAGSYPVATSDLLSAVPTWIAQYKKTFEQTGEHGDAVFMGDRAVRRAHGSTAVTNRPAIMREGNLWFTSLYGFFNHIMNRQYEIAWKAADAINKPGVDEAGRRLVKTSEGTYIPEEAKTGAAIIPTLAGATLAYVFYPALVEEIVTPLEASKDEGWTKWAGKALLKDLSSSWIFARDIAQAVLTGRDPSAGLVSTAYTTLTRFVRDTAKDRPLERRNRGKTLQDSITLFGAASGLTNQQMGRDARFMHDYLTGEVKPKGFGEWYRGLRYGTTKEFH